MKRRAAHGAFAGLLVLVAVAGGFGEARADPSSVRAARLVERMRVAPLTLRFSGAVRVSWRDRGATKHMTVDITDDAGVIQFDSDSARVFDRGMRTYFRTALGWSSALVEPDRGTTPTPDHHWRLAVRRGRTVAGRPTQLVEAVRADGKPALRLSIDPVTGLVLRREVLDASGHVQRSLEFVRFAIGGGAVSQPPSSVGTRDATPILDVPSGYEAPQTPAGYVLVARSRQSGGVELTYSDGMFSASVLEQRGDLDWDALPPKGTNVDIAGTRARRYSEASADVVMFEDDGTVFTLVTDAPPDSVASLVDSLTPGRSALEKVVDFVLGPFGWS
jgi:sigma-E factor negative regulatory protein RseB